MAAPTMRLHLIVFLTFSLALLMSSLAESSSTRPRSTSPRLYPNYYRKSCPRFDEIMAQTVTNKQIASPTTAAGTLRLFFHDCFLGGCDASVLVSSTPFNSAERDADINLSLPGDAFDVVVRAKTALELACPNTVSCADILAVAARDLVTMVGGPHYDVLLGRRDGLVSRASDVDGRLPRPADSISSLIGLFAQRGLSVQEMVALSGAHTIGFSHCKEFSSGIYNYSKTASFDPQYEPRFAYGLQRACADYQKNPALSVFNDVVTPNKFDNMYFKNLRGGIGLLKSDHGLYSDPRTKVFVDLYANDENRFFQDFVRAMEKLSNYGVKTGKGGEIRRRCDQFN